MATRPGAAPSPRLAAAPVAVTVLAAVLVAGCGASPGDGDLAIIDAHIHTDFSGEPNPASGISETRDRLLEDMGRAGVVGAISHTDSAGAGYQDDLRERGIIFCAGVGSTVDAERIRAGLESGRFRCIKIYLGYAQRFATDTAYAPAYRLARGHDVPVVFHTGDTWSARALVKYAHPLPIDEVAVAHPDVDFVIAHAGYPWTRTAAEVAYKNPNVYLEASAFMVGSAAEAPAAWVERYVVDEISWIFGYVEDPSVVLFGSDWPLVDMAAYVEAYKRAIPRAHWRAVFHDNAVRVFRLSPAAGGRAGAVSSGDVAMPVRIARR